MSWVGGTSRGRWGCSLMAIRDGFNCDHTVGPAWFGQVRVRCPNPAERGSTGRDRLTGRMEGGEERERRLGKLTFLTARDAPTRTLARGRSAPQAGCF